MSQAIATELTMEPKKKSVTIRFRASKAFQERLETAAEAKGLDASSYCRFVLTERMNADNVPPIKPKRTK